MSGEFWVTLAMGAIAGFAIAATIAPLLLGRRVRRLVRTEVRAALRTTRPLAPLRVPTEHVGGRHRRIA